VQGSFYVLLIAMPLSGWILSIAADRVPVYFGLFEVPLYGIPVSEHLSDIGSLVHEVIAYILVALISLHLLGALNLEKAVEALASWPIALKFKVFLAVFK
jgi:cytochrome b561